MKDQYQDVVIALEAATSYFGVLGGLTGALTLFGALTGRSWTRYSAGVALFMFVTAATVAWLTPRVASRGERERARLRASWGLK